jgi:uncharacterized delta-60 repeat protein
VAMQADGKMLVGGILYEGGGGLTLISYVLSRYNEDGTLDTSFGTDGFITFDIADYQNCSFILQPDGSIIVTGITDGQVFMARYFPGVSEITVTVS